MDPLKRKMEGQFASSFVDSSFVGSDLKTPPYAPPLHYHEESALRSTQAPQGYEPSNVSGLHLHDNVAAKPRRLPDWRSAQSAAVHDASSKANGRARSAAPAVQPPDVDVQESKDEILEVDTYFGHDSVYLFNAAADSKSFTLASEDDPEVQATLPPQADLAIKRLKRAQALADASSHVQPNPNTASAKESDCEDTPVKMDSFGTRCDTPRVFIDSPRLNATPNVIGLQKLKYNKDLHLRNTMRLVKAKLNQGAVLIIERHIDDKQLIKCGYSECPALDQIIMPGNYFVVIGDAKAPKDAEAWCLICLESLWAGEGMIGALPVPESASNALCGHHAPLSRTPSMELDGTIARLYNLRVDGSREDKAALPSPSHDLSNKFTERAKSHTYDTTSIPQSLLSSKHAPTPEELVGYPLTFQFPNKLPSPPFEARPETPGSPYTPSTSQMSSEGATTRFQHLAHYVTEGKSLDDQEQATLALWKKTSIEQVEGGEDPEEYGRAIVKHIREQHCTKADDETSEADNDAAWDEFAGQFDWIEEHRQIDESLFCALEFMSGLTKGDVVGRDLSDAFADMNTVRKEE
ncbi:hypothetical protein KC333_g3338 [Hortaea werneckii]|nr:hypothetical protein KC333_g3338 [Hortaea werneckii]KAI7323312.1 hypothetical protein KC326_g1578 [Hortaea werneckii]